MYNFSYSNPTKIHFGRGQVKKLSREIPPQAKVLIVYGGGSIKKNGVYEQVIEQLSNYESYEFSGIQANPKYEHIIEAVEIIRKNDIDFILAVGGGSVIDASKFIAIAALYEQDPWDFFTGQATIKHALPLGCILTLPATGSESNAGTVVTRGKDKLSCLSEEMRPRFAILDPEFTLSLPSKQVANGVVDAFVHVCEQYVTQELDTKNPAQNKIQDRYSESILTTLVEEGIKVRNQPENLSVRENIMWAANQALNGLIGAGAQQDWSTHLIGHELTALYNIDHAQTLSIILPALWKVRKSEKSGKLLQYGERVWGIKDGTVDERIESAIHKTEEFFVEMGLPIRLSEMGLSTNAVEEILACLNQHGYNKLGEDGGIDLNVSREILETALR